MAAIGAIVEISRVKPEAFLEFLPRIFEMLGEARDNWTLVKLVDVLTTFAQVEPRLLPKLEPKFKQLLSSQQSKSLQLQVIKSALDVFPDNSQIST